MRSNDLMLTPTQYLNQCAILMPFSMKTISPAFSAGPPACYIKKCMQVQTSISRKKP